MAKALWHFPGYQYSYSKRRSNGSLRGVDGRISQSAVMVPSVAQLAN
jgi:hypothetical protein